MPETIIKKQQKKISHDKDRLLFGKTFFPSSKFTFSYF